MAIPQNYHAVSVYLPPHLAQKVRDYALSNGLSRKSNGEDKPSLGTAILEILSAAFDSGTLLSPLLSALPAQTSSTLLSPLPENVLSNVLERLDKLESLTNTLLGNVPDESETLDNTLLSPLPSNVSFNTESITSTLPSPLLSDADNMADPIESAKNLPEGITNTELSIIIKVSKSTISRRLKKGEIEIDGYVHRDGKWYPKS